MPIRMSQYSLSIMRHHSNNFPKEPIPIVYPVVFYTGARIYTQPTELIQLFAKCDRDLAKQIHNAKFHLIDVNSYEHDDFEHYSLLGALVGAIKARHDFNKELTSFAHYLLDTICMGQNLYADNLLTYLLDSKKVESLGELMAKLESALPGNRRYEMQTFSQQLIEQGRAEGRMEGRIEGHERGQSEAVQAIAKRMLQEGYPPATVSELTGLSSALIATLL